MKFNLTKKSDKRNLNQLFTCGNYLTEKSENKNERKSKVKFKFKRIFDELESTVKDENDEREAKVVNKVSPFASNITFPNNKKAASLTSFNKLKFVSAEKKMPKISEFVGFYPKKSETKDAFVPTKTKENNMPLINGKKIESKKPSKNNGKDNKSFTQNVDFINGINHSYQSENSKEINSSIEDIKIKFTIKEYVMKNNGKNQTKIKDNLYENKDNKDKDNNKSSNNNNIIVEMNNNALNIQVNNSQKTEEFKDRIKISEFNNKGMIKEQDYERKIYKKLNEQKDILLGKYFNIKDIKSNILETEPTVENTAKIYDYSELFSKKHINGMPLLYPVICTNDFENNNLSKRNRYEEINREFYKLKFLMAKYKENLLNKNLSNSSVFNVETQPKRSYNISNVESEIIRQYLMSKNICNKEEIAEESVQNFINFLNKEPLEIDINKSLKDNVLNALNCKDKTSKDITVLYNNFNKFNNKDKVNCCNRRKKREKIDEDWIKYNLVKQNQVFNSISKSHKNILEMNNELKEELNHVDEEENLKYDLIMLVQNNKYLNNVNNKKSLNVLFNKEINSLNFRLQSTPQNTLNLSYKNTSKIRKISNLNDLKQSNERLYYNWFKKKFPLNQENYTKKGKLTEYVTYNKAISRIKCNELIEKINSENEKFNIKL